MNAKQVKQAIKQLKEHKGQHVLACWQRPMRTRKEAEHLRIEKRTCAYVRAGIDYANLATVKQGIENGTRDEVGSLPWGEWIDFPFLFSHKGETYIRLYPAVFANLAPSVEYILNGEIVTREQIEPHCLASEFRTRETKAECFAVNIENLVSIA